MRNRLTYSSFLAVIIGTGDAAVAFEAPGSAEHSSPANASPNAQAGGDPASDAPAAEPGDVSAAAGLFEQSQRDDGAKKASDGAPPAVPFMLNGYARGAAYVGEVPHTHRGDTKAAYGELSMALRTARQAYGDGYAEVRLRYGFQGGDEQNHVAVDVREAYVNGYFGPIDLRFGKQVIVWGRADMLNPTNNLTPADFRARSPIEDDRRLGNVGARVFLRLAPLRLEGVWLPGYTPTVLPALSLPKYVSFGEATVPRSDLNEGLGAARLHLELSTFEMSLSYANGYAPLPGLTLTNLLIQPDDPALGQRPAVVLSRTAYRQQVAGLDFSTAIGTLLALRGEVAYRRPYDYQDRPYAPHPDLQYVLGADHTFGSVSVIAQYLGRYTFDWKKENGTRSGPDTEILAVPYSDGAYDIASGLAQQELAKDNQILFSQTAQIQHLATARIEWLLAHDTLSLSVLGFRNFTSKEWLLAPKLAYHLSDSMIAYVGAEIFYGPTGTLFGMIDQSMSAGYAELRSTF